MILEVSEIKKFYLFIGFFLFVCAYCEPSCWHCFSGLSVKRTGNVICVLSSTGNLSVVLKPN